MLTFPGIFAELFFGRSFEETQMSRPVALYARVSTRGQELENQLAELSAACARND
jgi:predicted site-specific integrase-resolvase